MPRTRTEISPKNNRRKSSVKHFSSIGEEREDEEELDERKEEVDRAIPLQAEVESAKMSYI